jgi:hypothetical protein
MEQSVIFEPFLGMIALTFIVMMRMYVTRMAAIKRAGKPANHYQRPEGTSILPPEVNFSADNFKNLFEMPVLFYALCLGMWMAGLVDPVNVQLAWGYVALRAVHSYIQCGSNNVMARFRTFLLSSLILMLLFGRVALGFWF